MELIYKGSFRRDYKTIANKDLIKAIKKTIDEIKSARNISQISRLKKSENDKRFGIKLKPLRLKNEKPIGFSA